MKLTFVSPYSTRSVWCSFQFFTKIHKVQYYSCWNNSYDFIKIRPIVSSMIKVVRYSEVIPHLDNRRNARLFVGILNIVGIYTTGRSCIFLRKIEVTSLKRRGNLSLNRASTVLYHRVSIFLVTPISSNICFWQSYIRHVCIPLSFRRVSVADVLGVHCTVLRLVSFIRAILIRVLYFLDANSASNVQPFNWSVEKYKLFVSVLLQYSNQYFRTIRYDTGWSIQWKVSRRI